MYEGQYQSESDLAEQLSKVKQPYYDIEIGKICVWLKENGYTMHVTLKGDIEFRKKDLP